MIGKQLCTNYIIIILMVIVQQTTGQTNNSINLEIGAMAIDFKIKETPNYSMSSGASTQTIYLTLTKETQLKSPNFISFKYGIGVSKQLTDIYPDIHLNRISNFKDFPYDSIRVHEVAAWDYRINVPLIAEITLSKPIEILPPYFVIPGIKFKIGILNEMTVNRINVDNLLYAYKTESGNLVQEHYEETLNKKVSDYYSPMFSNYDMVGLIGLEFFEDYFDHYRVGVSGTYCSYLVSPINNKIKTSNDRGMSVSMFFAYKF